MDHDEHIHGIVTLHIPGDLSYLQVARQSLIDFCNKAGLPKTPTAELEMAVDEACTNIIEHAYRQTTAPAASQGLRMNLIQQKDRVVVELVDFGDGFDFDTQEAIDPERYLAEKRERGLGMFIIKNFVDNSHYERDPGQGNRLRLEKLL